MLKSWQAGKSTRSRFFTKNRHFQYKKWTVTSLVSLAISLQLAKQGFLTRNPFVSPALRIDDGVGDSLQHAAAVPLVHAPFLDHLVACVAWMHKPVNFNYSRTRKSWSLWNLEDWSSYSFHFSVENLSEAHCWIHLSVFYCTVLYQLAPRKTRVSVLALSRNYSRLSVLVAVFGGHVGPEDRTVDVWLAPPAGDSLRALMWFCIVHLVAWLLRENRIAMRKWFFYLLACLHACSRSSLRLSRTCLGSSQDPGNAHWLCGLMMNEYLLLT